MAIGTLAAVALGAGAIGSAALSAGAAGKASRAATDAANASAAVQREQLQVAQNALMPYQAAGLPASQTINALLGIGGTQPGQVDWGAYVNGNQDALANWNAIKGTSDGQQFNGDINAFGQYHYNADGSRRDLTPYTGTATSQADAAGKAFDVFKNSIGYQNTMNEAMRGVNSLYAGAGTIQSGAAIKAAQDRAANIAQGTLGNYLGYLGNQQGLGMSAGSALAGVGQNYANSMGNIYSQKADAIGNAALTNAANVNSLVGTLGAGIFKYGMK